MSKRSPKATESPTSKPHKIINGIDPVASDRVPQLASLLMIILRTQHFTFFFYEEISRVDLLR